MSSQQGAASSKIRTAHRSPLTAHCSLKPLTAHRSPLTAVDLGLEPVQNAEQNEALDLAAAAFAQAREQLAVSSEQLTEAIRSASSFESLRADISSFSVRPELVEGLSVAIFNIHLLGRAQIYADSEQDSKQRTASGKQQDPKSGLLAANSSPLTETAHRSPLTAHSGAHGSPLTAHSGAHCSQLTAHRSRLTARRNRSPLTAHSSLAAVVLETGFEPLPFDEAIAYWRRKTNLRPEQFAALDQAARAKAFTIAGRSSDRVRQALNEAIDEALSRGMTLREFQERADAIMDAVGLSRRTPWYWETVYRTNMATSYQVGRWKQMTDPAVVRLRPYLRYVSALLPTSRPSHKEKHGRIYPVDHPFWQIWYPPNGFNCFCTAASVSESLLARRGWSVSTDMNFAFPEPDEGWANNPGMADAV